MACLIIGLVNGRTVNLSHIASLLPGEALQASNYRRLQRFFQHVSLNQDCVAVLAVKMLNLGRRKTLALDRTNWQIGSTHVNILVLSIVTRRFRVPLLWSFMNHQGNSNKDQRTALIQRYLRLFEASSIELLLADREFIGKDWLDFLNENNVPFAIRLKEKLLFRLESGCVSSFKTLVHGRRARKQTLIWKGTLHGAEFKLCIAARQLKGGEWLFIASNAPCPKAALNAYKKRWAIECLFADIKTRGFNMEDTRLTCHKKLSTLLCIVALATIWAYRCATTLMERKAIKRKVHGRREKSWFRVGLDTLRNWINHKPDRASKAWQKTCPKRTIN